MEEKFLKENKIYVKDNETFEKLNENQIKAMLEIKNYMKEKYGKENKIIIENDLIKFVRNEEE
jgi:hypothetical protein